MVVNPLTFVPEDLDYSRTDYRHIMRKVVRYRDFAGYVPFVNWPKYPITAIFTCRGCTYELQDLRRLPLRLQAHDRQEKGGL